MGDAKVTGLERYRQDAGPARRHRAVIPRAAMPAVACAFCDSTDTEPTSVYGCHMMTAQYYCRACRSSFDWVRDERAGRPVTGKPGPGVG